MRPSLLAGPQAGRDFAKRPEMAPGLCAPTVLHKMHSVNTNPLFSPAEKGVAREREDLLSRKARLIRLAESTRSRDAAPADRGRYL